jgi:hypothetical protein
MCEVDRSVGVGHPRPPKAHTHASPTFSSAMGEVDGSTALDGGADHGTARDGGVEQPGMGRASNKGCPRVRCLRRTALHSCTGEEERVFFYRYGGSVFLNAKHLPFSHYSS